MGDKANQAGAVRVDFEENLSLKVTNMHYFRIKQEVEIKIYIKTSTVGCLLNLITI